MRGKINNFPAVIIVEILVCVLVFKCQWTPMDWSLEKNNPKSLYSYLLC